NNIQYCTYIKQSSIFKFGFIDTEGKYLVKTSENKVKTVLDDTTYIYNTNTPKKELFNESIEYKIIKNRIETLLNSENVNKYNKKRLLYVIHEGSGGTLHTSMELISQLTNEYDIYILSAGQTSIKLLRYNHIIQKETGKNDDAFKENISKLYEWELTTKYTLKKPYIPEYKRIYFNVLKILKIDMIHIRHLIRHTLDLPYIANKLEIPIILSFHDFYYICPAYTLIDDQNNYCAGKCSPIENYNGQCGVTVGLNVPILKTFVYTWRSYMKRLFNVCELFITTSNKAKKLYQEIYPELKDKEFKIIEHGRDIITPNNPLKRINKPVINNPTKILFPGHLSIAKGGKLIENIKKEDKDNLLELHYIGSISGMKELGKYGKDHGFYDRNKFNELVQDINPSFIGILSIWPETYCHTLTESWGAGIPVLTTNHGALGERVKENGGGWFISEDPKKAYKQIISIIQDENEYNNKVNEIKDITFKTTKEMSNEYKQIYEEIFKKKQDG
ncbi:MAG: glycosyltransferase, partial [Methanobacteriaceae archaeon]|nr:glycosyltransferase [Methanobacteriaceae archaeon]